MQFCVSCEMENVKQRVLEFEVIPEKVLSSMKINCFKRKVQGQSN